MLLSVQVTSWQGNYCLYHYKQTHISTDKATLIMFSLRCGYIDCPDQVKRFVSFVHWKSREVHRVQCSEVKKTL